MWNLPSPVIALALAVTWLVGPAAAQGTEESKTDSIGPWEIEATFKEDKFDRCSIRRTLDNDIAVTLIKTGDGMTLLLESPNWKLDRGKQYPVRMALGPQTWDTEVAAETNAVSIEVNDKRFASGLRTANALNVVAAGATIRVPLDRSTVALNRLDECVEKNDRAVETNPFVEPPRRP